MALLGQASSAQTIGELWYLHGPWGGAITRMQSSAIADVWDQAAVNPRSQQEIISQLHIVHLCLRAHIQTRARQTRKY